MRQPGIQSIGLSIAIAIALAIPAAVASAAEPAPGPARTIYASGTVTEIDLDLSQAAIEALEDEPDEYVPGDISLSFTDGTPGGVTRTLPTLNDVGIRLKGNVDGSFRPIDDKAAFKLKFNEFVNGQKLLGLKKLTLNNMVQDPAMLHETLSYEAFRAAGVPAPRTGYSFVRVNGEEYGVYMNVETFDDIALKRWFGDFDDDTQHLYEGEYGTDVTPGGAGAFEVDEGDDENIADLEALIAAVNAASPAFHARVEAVADLAEMTRMWAVEKYVGMWDGYAGTNFPKLPNNFFLYSDPAGRFQMFPWGTDQAWEGPLDFDGDAGLMFDKCIADPVCNSMYEEELRSAAGAIEGLELDSLATCIVSRLAPWQAMEVAPFREYDADEVEQGVEDTREVIADRPDELIEWLESQSGESEEITPSGDPASCAVPELDPEAEPEPGPKSGPKPASSSPVGSPGISQRDPLGLTKLRLAGRGAVDAVLHVPEPGITSVTGTIGTRRGLLGVCKTTRQVLGAGEVTLRCHLSDLARKRLRARWLKLHLTAWFASSDGEVETIARKVVVPRIDRG